MNDGDRRFRKTGWTFAQVPIWAICDPRLGGGQLRLFAYLVWRQGTDAGCWPGKRRMARDLDVSVETVRRWLRGLEKAGYIRVHERPGRSSWYEVVAEPGEVRAQYMPNPPQNCGGYPPQNCVYTPHKFVPHDDNHEQESNNDNMAAGPLAFTEWLQMVRQAPNKPAALREMFEGLYPDHEAPRYGRIGAAMKRLGGPGNLARLLWLYSARPPTGRVLDYIEKAEQAKGRERDQQPSVGAGEGEAAAGLDATSRALSEALRDREV